MRTRFAWSRVQEEINTGRHSAAPPSRHFWHRWLECCTPPPPPRPTPPQCGTADAEVKVSTIENPELTDALSLKCGVAQNIATDASPTARNVFLVRISTFPVHSPFTFSKFPSYFSTALVLVNAVSSVAPGNKIGPRVSTIAHNVCDQDQRGGACNTGELGHLSLRAASPARRH